MQKKLFIFDLDGTLLDTIDDLHVSVNATLSHFGYPNRTKAEVLSFVGNGYVPLLTLALPKSVCEEHFEEVVSYFKTYYAAHSREKTRPFAGVDILLGEEAPLVCEVNTNPHFRSTLDCTGVDLSEYIMRYILEKI